MIPSLPGVLAPVSLETLTVAHALHPLLQLLPGLPGLPGLPIDVLVVVAFLLMVGGVAGSVTPFLPSGLLSLVGIYVYWFASDFHEPGLLILSGLTLVAVVATLADWLSGAISAKAGGASARTIVVASVVGLVGLLIGPWGFLLGTAGTVFLLTYSENGDVEESLRTAGVTLLGMLTSTVLQLVLTVGVLVAMVLVFLL